MKYLRTIPNQAEPWFCWQAQIDDWPAASSPSFESPSCQIGPRTLFNQSNLLKNHWIIDNQPGLLTSHIHSKGPSGNKAGSLKALLLPVEVVTINTVIPQNNIADPGNVNPINTSHVFEGDNRSSGTPARATWNKDGSHRTQQKFNVIPLRNMGDADGLEDNAYNSNSPAGSKNSPFLNHVGTTNKYAQLSSLDTSGNLTVAARADTVLGDSILKTASATANNAGMKVIPSWLGDRKIKTRCEVKVGNPLASSLLGNEIDYIFDVTIDFTNLSAPRYSLEGDHDGFPAYEVYIGDKRIFQHDPLATGEGITSLFDPLEHNVSSINQLLR